MNKNEAWVKIGSALCVAMLGYLILNIFIKDMPLSWKICITSILAIVAFAVAFWAGKREIKPTGQSPDIKVGTGISSKGGVNLKDVTVKTNSGEDVQVGSDISSEKDVRIQNINIDSKG
jgi:hypothetical protein